MIIDKLTQFASAVSCAASTGTALIGDQVDTLQTAPDLGRGQPVYLNIVVTTAFASANSTATVQFKVASDDSASISTTTSTIHFMSPAHVVTELTAGKRYSYVLPAGINFERYVGLLVTTGVQTSSAGAITAFLSLDPGTGYVAFADASN